MRGIPKLKLADGHEIDFAQVQDAWEAPASEGKGVCLRAAFSGGERCGGAVSFVPDSAGAQRVRDALGDRLRPTPPATLKETRP